MRVLVTGGAGFIGSNFVRHVLRDEDWEVTTLDALTYAGSKENLRGTLDSPRHTFVEGDIRDRELVEELLTTADGIVNFAAESHVDRSIEGAKPFVDTNVQGTQTLLDAACNTDLERFVQISTDEVYGEIEAGEFSEDDRLDPQNPYAATKSGADHLVNSYHETYGLPTLVTRASNNFGPRQHPEKLIPKLITRAHAGETLPLYGDGSNVREWIYVEDTCRAIRTVFDRGETGEIYNIGSGNEYTNLQIAKQIVESTGATEGLIEFVPDRPGHDVRYALDSQKSRKLGWEPQWQFQDALEATVDFYIGGADTSADRAV